MSKMGLHDPFEYLKHKLWLKEGLGVKVSIWLLTIKSQELPWITCLQMVCKCYVTYFWKALNKGYNFALDLASIGGLHKKLRAFQTSGSFNFENFEIPNLGVMGKMTFGVTPMASHRKHCKGEGGDLPPPKSGPWWTYESMYVHGSSMYQKCSNYALTNLLFGLCRSIWIINPLVIHPNPHLGALACSFYHRNVVN